MCVIPLGSWIDALTSPCRIFYFSRVTIHCEDCHRTSCLLLTFLNECRKRIVSSFQFRQIAGSQRSTIPVPSSVRPSIGSEDTNSVSCWKSVQEKMLQNKRSTSLQGSNCGRWGNSNSSTSSRNARGNHGFHCKLYFIRDLPFHADVPRVVAG